MPNAGEVLDTLEGEALFDPSAGEILPSGTYPAHVKQLNVYQRTTRYGSEAQVYVPVYLIAPEAGEYAGVTVYDAGVWRFVADKDKETQRVVVGQGNSSYKKFLETFDIELPTVSNGDGRVLYKLPEITENDIIGHPVMINVHHEEWTGKFGEQRKAAKAKIYHRWADGKHLEQDSK